MKHLLFLCLLIGLSVVSCKKDEDPIVFPAQLQAEIDQVISSNLNLCDISRVEISEFDGKRYYNFYCDIWSCAYCHFYDEDGNHPDWDADKWNQYFAGKKEIKTVPACG